LSTNKNTKNGNRKNKHRLWLRDNSKRRRRPVYLKKAFIEEGFILLLRRKSFKDSNRMIHT